MALLFSLSSPASYWRSEPWRQSLQPRREEYRDCSSSDVQLVLVSFQTSVAALVSIEHTSHLDTDDNTSGHIVSGLDVTCVLVNLPSTHE